MSRGARWGAAMIAAASVSAGLALAAPTKTLTIGDLAVHLARAAGARISPVNPETSAAAFVRSRGLSLGDDLGRPALGRDLVTMGRILGAAVRTSEPSAAVTPEQGAAFAGAVRRALRGAEEFEDPVGTGATKEGGINAACRGREARDDRKGIPASPADPNATAPPCDEGEPQP